MTLLIACSLGSLVGGFLLGLGFKQTFCCVEAIRYRALKTRIEALVRCSLGKRNDVALAAKWLLDPRAHSSRQVYNASAQGFIRSLEEGLDD